jgi:hypothetical protein
MTSTVFASIGRRRPPPVPQGKTSIRWNPTCTPSGQETIAVAFAFGDCTPCPVRSRCTRARSTPRSLTVRPELQHQAIRTARERQATPSFKADYA